MCKCFYKKKRKTLYDPKTNQFSAKTLTVNLETIKKSLVESVCLHLLIRRDEINVKLTGKGKTLIHYMSIYHTASREDPAQHIEKQSFCPFKSFLLEQKINSHTSFQQTLHRSQAAWVKKNKKNMLEKRKMYEKWQNII